MGWRVCWIGGWDKCRVLFVVMVERQDVARTSPPFFRGPYPQAHNWRADWAALFSALKLRATAIIAIDNPILHHKINLLRDFDIVERISWNAHYIGHHARL